MVSRPLLHQEAVLDAEETDKWTIRAPALREACGAGGTWEGFLEEVVPEFGRCKLGEGEEKGHFSSRSNVQKHRA